MKSVDNTRTQSNAIAQTVEHFIHINHASFIKKSVPIIFGARYRVTDRMSRLPDNVKKGK